MDRISKCLCGERLEFYNANKYFKMTSKHIKTGTLPKCAYGIVCPMCSEIYKVIPWIKDGKLIMGKDSNSELEEYGF